MVSRRGFLGTLLGAVAAAVVVPTSVFGERTLPGAEKPWKDLPQRPEGPYGLARSIVFSDGTEIQLSDWGDHPVWSRAVIAPPRINPRTERIHWYRPRRRQPLTGAERSARFVYG